MNGGEVIFKFKGNTEDVEEKTEGLAKKLTSKFGTIGTAIGKSVLTGTTMAIGGLTAMVTAGVNSYASLEQSIGGVETLFKENADKVIANAQKAYTTAGMSANKYMETVTSFSASLLQSLEGDTEKAVGYADRAIIDMSDNANKMGTDISMIQSAYQGFAKQNYTMLDNLKLGYGGTQTEMKRLIKDASKLTSVQKKLGVTVDAESMSFANIVNAISVMQDSMGIAGTTSQEASDTISGSMNSAKAAFDNFINGSGDVQVFVDAVATAGRNIFKTVEDLAPKIIDGVLSMVNEITKRLPETLARILPVLISGAVQLISGLTQALPDLIPVLLNGIVQAFTLLIPLLPQIFQTLLYGAITIINALAEQMPVLIPQIINAIIKMIPILINNIPLFLDAGWRLLIGIVQGILNAVPTLLSYLPGIVWQIISYFNNIPSQMWNIGYNLVVGLWNGIANVTDWVLNKIKGFGNSILRGIKNIFGIHSPSKVMFEIGGYIDEGFINGIDDMQKDVQKSFNNLIDIDDAMFNLSPNLYGNSAINMSTNPNITVINNMEQDPLGQMVNNIKTFSGGSKNDYNYGQGV